MMINLMSFLGDTLELDSDYEKVHRTLVKLRISYPSELARETYLDLHKVKRIIDYYVREGAFKYVELHPEIIHPKLLPRLQYFWGRGIVGIHMFRKMNWIECNDKPYWGDKKKFQEEKQVNEEIVS